MSSWIRKTAFSLMGLIMVVLVVGTIVEQLYGADVAQHYVYTAPWTMALWLAAAGFGLAYVLKVKKRHEIHWSSFCIHISFLVILLGAMLTHVLGRSGALHLRLEGKPQNEYECREGGVDNMPFLVVLKDFQINYYPGTATPADYVSYISIMEDNWQTEPQQGGKLAIDAQPQVVLKQGVVRMNNIFRYKGWRFYQSAYDEDQMGCTLLVSYDPLGIGVTYLGYLMLLVSMLCYLLVPHKGHHHHHHHVHHYVQPDGKGKRNEKREVRNEKRGMATILLLLVGLSAMAGPKALQRPVAESFGNLYVQYNGRVCPMSSLALDVCEKLYGGDTYRSADGTKYTACQVLTGLFFYPDDWMAEPLKPAKRAAEQQDKEMIRQMVVGGDLLKIWPGETTWADVAHPLANVQVDSMARPGSITPEEAQFRLYALQYVAYDLMQGKNVEANDTLHKLRKYQQQVAVGLPDEQHFRTEQTFRRWAYTKPLAMVMLLLGLVFFFGYCITRARGKHTRHWALWTMAALLAAAWVFLTVMLGMRWYISGHVPMSNGHETMQALAWLVMPIAIGVGYKNRAALPSGFLVSAMALMVSMMTASNPQITHLMPVLQSPLLSLHVSVIMLSYALFALAMLNGLVALFLPLPDQRGMMHMTRKMLKPAVCLLTMGIFLGAVWANVSWGRYWGWDPKEVWALITLMVYAAPLHRNSLPAFSRPRFFHIYCIVAFLAVLMTYFGVNFFLGGMHSYA